MSAFFRLRAEFDVLTPLFLGGALQQAELRTPSIKGALRFWYRALDPSFRVREPELFGSGGETAGQALLFLRCKMIHRTEERIAWPQMRAEQFNQGNGKHTRNGFTYLGFPLAMKGNQDRSAIVPGARFSVEVTRRCASRSFGEDSNVPLRAALACLWALGHFGSLGTRARRGFGAVTLTGWRLEDENGQVMACDEIDALPMLLRATTPQEWESGARRGLQTLGDWFGTFGHSEEQGSGSSVKSGRVRRSHQHHLHFGSRADFVIGRESIKREDWRGAIVSLGRALQGFRQRRPPDYGAVKDQVLWDLRSGGQPIRKSPDRATFGLPLTFRYGSVPRGRPVTFTPVEGERHGSLLLLRPVLVNDMLASLFLRLDGDVPGIDTRLAIRGTARSLEPADANAVDDFLREMKGRASP